MSTFATVIGLFVALLPFAIGYVARSKGRSPLIWGLLSVVLTPFGSLILLLALPEQDRGEAGNRSADLGMIAFAKMAFGDRADAVGHAELDEKLTAEAREARVDQLITEHLNALRTAPAPNAVPTSVPAAAVRPTFGKRR